MAVASIAIQPVSRISPFSPQPTCSALGLVLRARTSLAGTPALHATPTARSAPMSLPHALAAPQDGFWIGSSPSVC